MLELFWLISLSFTAAISGAVVPGPVFVLVVSESLRKGKKVGPLVVLGHLVIEGLIILMVFLGLGFILQSAQVTASINCLGGIVLVIMGSFLIRTARRFRVETISERKIHFTSHGLVAAGLLSSGSNPQFFLWWLTIGVPMIAYSVSVAGAIGFAFFFLGHAIADLLWFGTISFAIDRGKAFLNQKTIRIILLASAIFLIVFGFFSAYTAFKL